METYNSVKPSIDQRMARVQILFALAAKTVWF